MSIKLNRKVWKTVEAITLRLLNDSCRFPGAKRFVITGTVPGKTELKMLQMESTFQNSFGMQGWSLGHLARQNDTYYTIFSIGALNSFLTRHMMSFYQPVELFHIH